MLRIPEKTLENAMIALIGLDMGEGVEQVAEAALTLLRRERRQREKDARGPPRGKATLVEANAAEAAKTNAPVGVPYALVPRPARHAHQGTNPCWLLPDGEGCGRQDGRPGDAPSADLAGAARRHGASLRPGPDGQPDTHRGVRGDRTLRGDDR